MPVGLCNCFDKLSVTEDPIDRVDPLEGESVILHIILIFTFTFFLHTIIHSIYIFLTIVHSQQTALAPAHDNTPANQLAKIPESYP